MQAETLNCPMCGAAASTDATRCQFCDARLATAQCPSCFGMMFIGDRHCPRCGARAARAEDEATQKEHRCPRCYSFILRVAVGSVSLLECARCGGLWVDAQTFERICADREQQSTVLLRAHPSNTTAQTRERSEPVKVRYVPCPVCNQLMNRANFAHYSGVIIDTCKEHGAWFDCDELARVVEFIHAGGLEAARAREKEQLADERRRLRSEQLKLTQTGNSFFPGEADEEIGLSLSAAELLKRLLG